MTGRDCTDVSVADDCACAALAAIPAPRLSAMGKIEVFMAFPAILECRSKGGFSVPVGLTALPRACTFYQARHYAPPFDDSQKTAGSGF
ncbi:hypothetical protein GCM10009038_08410 [Salinicola rhizosphaerae]|uniref:Uncharacterized protein n=1 Tax=Salinicola rhizosphaerae TaxID=1443141 RepID=A0ABQ3DR09_9GAMM|nr:hypothetical protein GCM10009038_08410 [Salinicola rhizosphaerae]